MKTAPAPIPQTIDDAINFLEGRGWIRFAAPLKTVRYDMQELTRLNRTKQLIINGLQKQVKKMQAHIEYLQQQNLELIRLESAMMKHPEPHEQIVKHLAEISSSETDDFVTVTKMSKA